MTGFLLTMLGETITAGRSLLRHHRLALVIAATMALAIGANTAVFSLVRAVLLEPLPFREPNRLVTVSHAYSEDGRRLTVPFLFVEHLRTRSAAFEDVAAFVPKIYHLESATWITVDAAAVTPNLFAMLGVHPIIGRLLGPDDERHRRAVLVLSERAWRRFFGGDPAVLGRRVRLFDGLEREGRAFEVIGVVRADLSSLMTNGAVDVFVPDLTTPTEREFTASFPYHVIGRVRRDLSLTQVRDEVARHHAAWVERFPRWGRMRTIVLPLHEAEVGRTRPAMLLLTCAVGVALLVACVNIAALQLAAGAARQRELAVRAAVGASRWRLIRHVLIENAILATAGGAGGVGVAVILRHLIVALAPADLPRLQQVVIDARVIIFALGVSVLTGIVSGLLPALTLSRVDLVSAFHGGRSTGRLGAARWRDTLAAGQLALTLALLVWAGLAGSSFLRLAVLETGLDTRNVLVADLQLGSRAGEAAPGDLGMQILRTAWALPGVAAAAVSIETPFSPVASGGTILEFPDGRRITTAERVVSNAYFRLLGLTVLHGQVPGAAKAAAHDAVVNRAFALRCFGRENVVGERLPYGYESLEIVAVVSDVRDINLKKAPVPTLYRGFERSGGRSRRLALLVRSHGTPERLAAPLRAALAAVAPWMPVTMTPLETRLRAGQAENRMYAVALGAFGGFSVLLATIGISAAIRDGIRQRTHELGVRMSLGATPMGVAWVLLRRLLMYSALAAAGGLALAVLGSRLGRVMLFETTAADPVALVGAVVLLLAVVLPSVLAPTWRVTRLSPAVTFRQE